VTSFRVLHVSDFHIGEYADRSDPRWAVKAAIKRWGAYFTKSEIKKRVFGASYPGLHFATHRVLPLEDIIRFVLEPKNAIDFVVCSGDLAATGHPNDLKASLNYFEKGIRGFGPKAETIRAGLLSSGKRVFFMPGNHDRYGDKGAAGNKTFDLIYQRFWGTKKREHIDHIVAVKNGVRLIVIAADFTLKRNDDAQRVGVWPKSLTKWGQGKCYEETLVELESHTQAVLISYPSCTVVWAVHFPPSSVKDERLKLIDGEKVLIKAKELNVGVLLSGHVHEKMTNTYSNCVSLTAGSCSAVDAVNNHEAHILTFDLEGNSIKKLTRDNLHIEGGVFVLNGVPEVFEAELKHSSSISK
jgi:predicted phosphodiesterase